MKKSELIDQISRIAGISRSDAKKALAATTVAITAAMEKGNSVRITGFGTFYVGKRAERSGRNPRTGATIKIKASSSPKFRAGKSLKEHVYAVSRDQDEYVSFSRKSGTYLSKEVASSKIKPGGTDSTGPRKPQKKEK